MDSEGNIIVPKSVRPIIDSPESHLGIKRGALRQYRYGRLHVREYEDAYSVHMDRISPEVSPLGHLLIDAPEYAVGASVGLAIGKKVGMSLYKRQKREGKSNSEALVNALAAGCFAGVFTGGLAHSAIASLKKGRS